MKRHEKMTKEEIINFTLNYKCSDCLITARCKGCCEEAKSSWLNEEIEIVPRWKTIKNDDDVKLMFEVYSDECRSHECSICRFHDALSSENCFVQYLTEKVEVSE